MRKKVLDSEVLFMYNKRKNENRIARVVSWLSRLQDKVNLVDETATEEIDLLYRGQHDLNTAVGQLRKQVEKLEEEQECK